jgi:undecaprenyl pyrophosphate phosphatase UppP
MSVNIISRKKITMLSTDRLQSLREKMKQSRAKIWIRTGLLTIFSVIFGMYLVRDVSSGVFRWEWGLAVFVLCFPLGMWMSRLVPMQAQSAEIVTLSFDRIYFLLIWLLVIAKFILGRIPGMHHHVRDPGYHVRAAGRDRSACARIEERTGQTYI